MTGGLPAGKQELYNLYYVKCYCASETTPGWAYHLEAVLAPHLEALLDIIPSGKAITYSQQSTS